MSNLGVDSDGATYQLTVIHNQRNDKKSFQVKENDIKDLLTANSYSDDEKLILNAYETVILNSAKGQLPVEEVVLMNLMKISLSFFK